MTRDTEYALSSLSGIKKKEAKVDSEKVTIQLFVILITLRLKNISTDIIFEEEVLQS